MSVIRRPLTRIEHGAVKAALPIKLKSLMDEIEFVIGNCWNCDHYEGFEGTPGKCRLHGVAIPNDERSKEQDCHVTRVVPF